MTRWPVLPARAAVVAAVLAVAALAGACEQAEGEVLAGHVTFARSSGRAIDLYTIELPDGQLERHTEGPGTSTSPAWSPDGRHLAFARRVGPPYNLWMLDVRTGELAQITEGTAIDGHPTWSPDGSRLAFASNRGPGAAFAIHLVERGGGSPMELTAGRAPAWAPSGDRVAFERNGALFIIDVGDGEERRVTDGRRPATAPAWSPDGNRLVFARPDDAGGLHIVELDGGAVERLTDDPGDRAPAWSPDGSFVVFVRPDTRGSDLHVVEVASGRERRITHGSLSDVAPTWRPVP